MTFSNSVTMHRAIMVVVCSVLPVLIIASLTTASNSYAQMLRKPCPQGYQCIPLSSALPPACPQGYQCIPLSIPGSALPPACPQGYQCTPLCPQGYQCTPLCPQGYQCTPMPSFVPVKPSLRGQSLSSAIKTKLPSTNQTKLPSTNQTKLSSTNQTKLPPK